MDPLISCLMVTRGNLFPAAAALKCYQAQTYRNRELVIVCDAPDSPVSSIAAGLGDSSIRYVAAKPAPLGELRNISVQEARGALLCQWDDDDLYHPKRLEVQAKRLLDSQAAAHFLARWLMWWPARRQLALSAGRAWEGTMLARREVVGSYPALARGEDAAMVRSLLQENKVEISDEPDLYCYVVHGGNTWSEAHFEERFREASWIYSDYEAELERRSLNLPVRLYEQGMGAGRLFRDRSFGKEKLVLDGASFINCRFNETAFEFSGGQPPKFEDCHFVGVSFGFKSSAKNTFDLLRWLNERGILHTIAGGASGGKGTG